MIEVTYFTTDENDISETHKYYVLSPTNQEALYKFEDAVKSGNEHIWGFVVSDG